MKRYKAFFRIAALLCICLIGGFQWGIEAAAQDRHSSDTSVRINGSELTPEQLQEFEALCGVKPVPGDYWYDAISGLYGTMGQQAMGMMMPGHLFGQLPGNASNGDTGVFMNGRNLTALEVNYINLLIGTQALPGRYWLDAFGNCGVEGLLNPLVNFYEVSRFRFGSSGDNFWSSHFSAGNFDSGNTRGYVSVPGHGPVGY